MFVASLLRCFTPRNDSFIFLFYSLFFCSSLYASSEDIIQQAVALRNQGQFEESEKILKNSVQFAPANPDVHFELANLYASRLDDLKLSQDEPLGRSFLEKSVYELKEVIALTPDNLPAHYNLGVIFKRFGRYEAAREEFRTVLEIDPKQAAAYVQLGQTYEDQGFFEDARSSYRTASELDFGNESIQTLLQDLDHHEAEAKEKGRQADTRRSYRARSGFDSWLTQELMRARSARAAQSQ